MLRIRCSLFALAFFILAFAEEEAGVKPSGPPTVEPVTKESAAPGLVQPAASVAVSARPVAPAQPQNKEEELLAEVKKLRAELADAKKTSPESSEAVSGVGDDKQAPINEQIVLSNSTSQQEIAKTQVAVPALVDPSKVVSTTSRTESQSGSKTNEGAQLAAPAEIPQTNLTDKSARIALQHDQVKNWDGEQPVLTWDDADADVSASSKGNGEKLQQNSSLPLVVSNSTSAGGVLNGTDKAVTLTIPGQFQLVREHVAKPLVDEAWERDHQPVGVLATDPAERNAEQEREKWPIFLGIILVISFTVYWTQKDSLRSLVKREVAYGRVPGFPDFGEGLPDMKRAMQEMENASTSCADDCDDDQL